MTTAERVCAVLEANGIGHALINAAALAARGVARSTYDIDLIISDPRILEPRLWTPLQEGGATVDIRRGDADDPLGGVVRIEASTDRPVDLILGKHAWHTRAVTRAEPLPGGPPVVLARDLVLLKLYAGGPQDLWDVRELLKQPDAETLFADVSADLVSLPAAMQDLWRTIGA